MSQSLFLDRPGWCAVWQIVEFEISISADEGGGIRSRKILHSDPADGSREFTLS